MNRTEQMGQLFESGRTYAEIGLAFNLSRQRVHQILSAVGYSGEDGGAAIVWNVRRSELREKQEKEHIEKYGLSVDQVRELRRAGVTRKFQAQRRNAQVRSIEWELTLGQWWRLWQESGLWGKRGRGDGYCMARKGDIGPYSACNIYFCTNAENAKDGFVFKPANTRKIPNRPSDAAAETIEAERRRHVATLHARGLSCRGIQAALAAPPVNCANAKTGKPWGVATIHHDLSLLSES